MRLSHRRALLAAPLLLATPLRAQGFPERSIRLVVPFPPGGATDGTARVLAEHLTTRYGRPVVVDNRAGAGGLLGTELVARATPDGHTWLLASAAPLALSPLLVRNLAFDPRRELAPVSMVMTTDHVMAVNPRSPARDVAGFIALAKAKSGGLNFASNGVGTAQHLAAELFMQATGTRMVHVPYRGSGQVVADLAAGVVDVNFDTLPSVLPFIRQGQLRGLAVTTRTRSDRLPEAPTVIESGVPGYDIDVWYMLLGPAGLPEPTIARWSQALGKALADPALRTRIGESGFDVAGGTPQQAAALVASDTARYGEAIRRAGIILE